MEPLPQSPGAPVHLFWAELSFANMGPSQIFQPSSAILTQNSKNPEFWLSLGCRGSRTRQKHQPCAATARESGLPSLRHRAGKRLSAHGLVAVLPQLASLLLVPLLQASALPRSFEKPGSCLSTAMVTVSLASRARLCPPILCPVLQWPPGTQLRPPCGPCVWGACGLMGRQTETVATAF